MLFLRMPLIGYSLPSNRLCSRLPVSRRRMRGCDGIQPKRAWMSCPQPTAQYGHTPVPTVSESAVRALMRPGDQAGRIAVAHALAGALQRLEILERERCISGEDVERHRGPGELRSARVRKGVYRGARLRLHFFTSAVRRASSREALAGPMNRLTPVASHSQPTPYTWIEIAVSALSFPTR